MKYDDLIKGLIERGFVGTEGICNMGDCNRDDKDFILLTDGLVIWSDYWDWKHASNCAIWACEKWTNDPDTTPEFLWEPLDKILGKKNENSHNRTSN